MREELQRKLCADFPQACKDWRGDPMRTCMAWGFDVGNGWEPIIRDVLQCVKNAGGDAVGFTLDQVKEKFGLIRIYWHCNSDKFQDEPKAQDFYKHVDNIIDNAEERSGRTCEGCGRKGLLRNDHGWLRTTCNPLGGPCLDS